MINTLVDGGSIAITHVKINFSVDDFTILKELINLRSNEKIEPEGLDILFSYLFIAGYLTEDRNGRYKIPNQEIKYAFLTSLIAYYRKVYGLSNDIIDDITDNLQTLFEKDHLVINSEEKFEFVEDIFISEFQPTFNEIIQQCLAVTNKCATEGIFANEDVIHSILNVAAMKVSNAFFGTEMYVSKIVGNESAHENVPDLNLKTSKRKETDEKVRLNIVLKSEDTGLVAKIQYGDTSNATVALKQAETYANSMKDEAVKIFVGLHVSTKKEVTIVGKVYVGNEFRVF